MHTDPVCKMTLDPAEAAASLEFEGERLYFCSTACRDRFRADPAAYRPGIAQAVAGSAGPSCPDHGANPSFRLDPKALGVALAAGALSGTGLLAIYFGVLTLVSGWSYALDQFGTYWPFIVTLAVGFGVQVGLFVYLRWAVRAAGSGKVVAVTGGTSGAAMLSCCTHYLVNLLPVLGATGLVSLVGQYQVEVFWVGVAANLAGIAYMSRRLAAFAHGA